MRATLDLIGFCWQGLLFLAYVTWISIMHHHRAAYNCRKCGP